MLVLDSINFGSGWFPTLRKRPDVGLLHGGVRIDRLHSVNPVGGQLTNYGREGVDVAGVLGQDVGTSS